MKQRVHLHETNRIHKSAVKNMNASTADELDETNRCGAETEDEDDEVHTETLRRVVGHLPGLCPLDHC